MKFLSAGTELDERKPRPFIVNIFLQENYADGF